MLLILYPKHHHQDQHEAFPLFSFRTLTVPFLTFVFNPWNAFFFFFNTALWHMEVPGLGVESELQLLAYTTGVGSEPHLRPEPMLVATPEP